MNRKQIELRNAIVDVLQGPQDKVSMFKLIRTASLVLRSGEGITWTQVHDALDSAYDIDMRDNQRLEYIDNLGDVLRNVQRGDKIPKIALIKIVRALTGTGLYEAKQLVEQCVL
jgi:hypothetical protein